MAPSAYDTRRDQLLDYFDRTASDAWAKLTSDAPVGRIRATVRAGRDRMRSTLLGWLPADLTGQTLLDAGCGTGALAREAARRGARVVATDLAPTLVALAQQRQALDADGLQGGSLGDSATGPTTGPTGGSVEYRVADMMDPSLGQFDWVVAMDSLIHYAPADMTDMVAGLAAKARRSLVFTFAPRTPLLAVMHSVGRMFPKSDRSPDLEPIAEDDLRTRIAAHPALAGFAAGRSERVKAGFYTSQAMEIVRS